MRIHPALLPPVVALLFLGSILAARSWELPTMQHRFSDAGSRGRNVQMVVEGLRCRGTSSFFVQRLEQVPGLLAVGTYVQEHRATITYDPSLITPQRIQEIIEEPIMQPDGMIVRPFRVSKILE